MAAMAQLRFSPLNNKETLIGGNHHRQYSRSSPPLSFSLLPSKFSSSSSSNLSISLLQTRASSTNPNVILKTELLDTGGNDNGIGNNSGGGGGDNNNGGGGWNGGSDGSEGGESNDGDDGSSSSSAGFGILGLFINGWRSRVMADSQFPFKVLMEEVVGVSSCVLGDMASRPNFGLNELDFVFSTLVVGSILNFTLMYLLAPTMGSGASTLPGFFANCPSSHMFESGAFSVLDRFGTFVYKGTVFAGVGFAAGLVGTALSNGLIKLRKKMDPEFETPNQAPPTLLNAMTWATHMGLSSNLRYQTLNGVEFLLAKALPPVGFKTSVVVLRCLNNVLGGVSFVLLARLTGSQKSQKVEEKKPSVLKEIEEAVEEKVKLLDDAAYQSSGKVKAKQQYARNRQRRT